MVNYRISILAVILIATITSSNVVASTNLVPKSMLLSTNDANLVAHVEPSMAILADGTIFASWKDSYSNDGGGLAVSYSYSTDDGASWTAPQYIPTSFIGNNDGYFRSSYQSDPWMVSYGNTLYFSYIEYNNTNSQITMAHTSDLGKHWTLTKATNNTGFADKETFTIDTEGYIYLVYDDVLLNRTEVRLSRSFDGGLSFHDNVTINDAVSTGYVGPYIIHGDKGQLFVAVSQFDEQTNIGDILFDRSTDYGNSWGNDTDINPSYNASTFTNNPNTQRPEKVSLGVLERDSTGRIYLAWDDVSQDPPTNNFDVYFRYSDDNGSTWSDRIMVNNHTKGDQWMPEMALDVKGNVHFIYYDQAFFSSYVLMYRVWNVTTEQFDDPIQISNDPISVDIFTRPGEYTALEISPLGLPMMVWSNALPDDSFMDVYFTTFGVPEPVLPSPSDQTASTNVPWFFSFSVLALVPLRRWRKGHDQ